MLAQGGATSKYLPNNNLTCDFDLYPLMTFLLNYYRDLWSAVICLCVVIMIQHHGPCELLYISLAMAFLLSRLLSVFHDICLNSMYFWLVVTPKEIVRGLYLQFPS